MIGISDRMRNTVLPFFIEIVKLATDNINAQST